MTGGRGLLSGRFLQLLGKGQQLKKQFCVIFVAFYQKRDVNSRLTFEREFLFHNVTRFLFILVKRMESKY